MATFTITIPTDKVTKTVDAFCSVYGYQPTINVNGEDVPNPETKVNFSKRMVNEFVKNTYINYQLKIATEALETQKRATITQAETEAGVITTI